MSNAIVQIMPAEGYHAIFANKHWEEHKARYAFRSERLACWALVEADDLSRSVVGMLASLETGILLMATDQDAMVGYVDENYLQASALLHGRALEYIEQRKGKP